jgi:hypothetical protein
MADKNKKDNLSAKAAKRAKSGQKAKKSAKIKTKDNLVKYTKQLTLLGNLQQAIVVNLQKEIGKI